MREIEAKSHVNKKCYVAVSWEKFAGESIPGEDYNTYNCYTLTFIKRTFFLKYLARVSRFCFHFGKNDRYLADLFLVEKKFFDKSRPLKVLCNLKPFPAVSGSYVGKEPTLR